MENEVIVEIKDGKVKGYGRRGVIKFKGIPYAAPPIGDLRFQPPGPVEPWDGILECKKYSAISPQPKSALEAMFGEQPATSEKDCLTLNVWTKNLVGKKPVMFWIHGGGFTTGNGGSLDGSRLTLRGDVVVVSINYRLGPLGFLVVPDLPNTTANAGLLDMIAALKWTNNNIHLFGGDPDNVTIFGESAGGFAVAGLLSMVDARGLFNRAITQSGAAHPESFRMKTATKAYELFIKKLGIEKGNIEELRKIPANELIKAQQPVASAVRGEFLVNSGIRLGPVVDNKTMIKHPLEAVRNGDLKSVSLFVGTNLDEATLFNMWNPKSEELDEESLIKNAHVALGTTGKSEEEINEMIEIYRDNRKSPRNVMDALATDYRFRIPSILLAEAQSPHQKNTYMYLFSWKSPLQGGKLGATHALELGFVFGILGVKDIGINPKRTDETEALSNNMMDCWINFARTGNPNHDNIPKLPSYDSEDRHTIIFDKEITIEKDPFGRERAAWDSFM